MGKSEMLPVFLTTKQSFLSNPVIIKFDSAQRQVTYNLRLSTISTGFQILSGLSTFYACDLIS